MKKILFFILFLLQINILYNNINIIKKDTVPMNITKAVIPAAGFGTRCLPFSKSIPKEMLPLLEKPAIHYIFEEGLQSGMNDFCIIANDDKIAIKNYVTHNVILESFLDKKKNLDLLGNLNHIINNAQFHFIPQLEALGLGHAILMARETIGNNYFGVFLPDMIIINKTPAMAQLITIAQKYNASVIAVHEVPHNKVSAYGIVGIKREISPGIFELSHLVEKPTQKDAPSNFAITGRYIFSPRIFNSITVTPPDTKGEIQITDAITHMMQHGEKVIACTIEGTKFDIGNTAGWIQANTALALAHPNYKHIITDLVEK